MIGEEGWRRMPVWTTGDAGRSRGATVRVLLQDWGKTVGMGLEETRNRWTSADSLPASVAGVSNSVLNIKYNSTSKQTNKTHYYSSYRESHPRPIIDYFSSQTLRRKGKFIWSWGKDQAYS